MSGRSQPSEHLPKDPIRIVYHAQNRTFARLFNERSLDEVKDVVRRKLGLGRETDVSLKQMGSGPLLDLEDDDDFQAFRILLRSCVCVDIQVTVGRSRGSTVLPPVAPVSQATSNLVDVLKQRSSQLPREQPSASEPTATSSVSPSKSPRHPASSGPSSVRPGVPRTTQVPSTAPKTPGPSTRKRKVSFEDAALAAPDKSAERRAPTKVTPATPVASSETAETSAAPKPVGAEEPPKKRQKKDVTKARDLQPTEAVQSPAVKASDASKPKPRKSAALDRGSEAETSTLMDAVTAELVAKKPKRQKKDDGAGPTKSSAPVDQGGMDQPINQPDTPVNKPSLQPASEKPTITSAEGSVSRTRKGEKTRPPRGTACAAIPRTSASTSVQSEVAAAILSGYLSKASEAVPPEPPAKRKYVRKDTKKSSASSSALPVESTTVLAAPANEVPNVPKERRLQSVVLTNGLPRQISELNGPPCPICLEEPFHIRYCCPTVLKGPDAIRARLEELERTNMGDQQSLIKELEGLLRDSKVMSIPSSDASPIDGVQSREVSSPPNVSVPQTPNIPSNSCMSEVTVESRDEGSSSESSDDTSEGGVEDKELTAPQRHQTPNEQPSLANDDLDAVVRGPESKRQSILNVIDRIVGDEDDKDSESEEDEVELEEDPDEEIDRSRRRWSSNIKRTSDSESEDDGSRSPSPSPEGISNNLGPGIQGSNKPSEESAKHQDSDVVMKDPVDAPVLEGQDDDSSEETHVGSEGRMDVDHGSIGEKGAATIVEQQPSSPSPRNEPQESGQSNVDLTSSREGGAPVASVAPDEVEADPIEPADELEPPTNLRSDADPIEVTSEDIGALFAVAAESTAKPGVTKRIKDRNGQIPDDEAERPVLLEQLTSVATDEVTPVSTERRLRNRVVKTYASQEPVSVPVPVPVRKSPRLTPLPPSTSTPLAVTLLNLRSQVGARKAAKTPAKQSKEQSDASQSRARNAPTPSLARWEILPEPSSPSVQLEETSVRIDELMSSSPHPDDIPIRGRRLSNKQQKGRTYKSVSSSQAEISKGKERLFDLSSSQIPFPYSQYQNNPTPTVFANGKEKEKTTDSEEEPKVSKKKTKPPARYRSLSQLASQATLFSPSLPTPTNKSLTDGKSKKRVADEDSSSSSSSSDADEANGSEHIPRGRRAASALETRQKKKSILSRI